MLTPFIRRQLIAFAILTVVSIFVLGVYYLQVPSLVGIGRYDLKAELPASGGLYPTANVTYRGITIGMRTMNTARNAKYSGKIRTVRRA